MTDRDDTNTLELCNDRGPRVGSEGAMYCVLPKGHKDYHQGDPSWRQPGWPQWWSDQERHGSRAAGMQPSAPGLSLPATESNSRAEEET